MSSLLWKTQSKVSSAYSVAGINAVMRKSADDGHFSESTRRRENAAEKPISTHGTVHPPFLPRRGVPVFPSQSRSACGDGSIAGLRVHPTRCWRAAPTPVWSTERSRTPAPPANPAGCPRDARVRAALRSCASLLLAAAGSFRWV